MPWGSRSVLRVRRPGSAWVVPGRALSQALPGRPKPGTAPAWAGPGAASGAGVLAATVGVDNQARSPLAQRQGLFQRVEHQPDGHPGGQVPVHHPPRTGISPSGRVAPAPARQGQAGRIAHPHPVRNHGRGRAQKAIFGHDGGRVSDDSAGPVQAGAQGLQVVPVPPHAQRVAAHGVAFDV